MEDGLDHLSSIVLLGGRSHKVRTLPAMDIYKEYDASHRVFLVILQGALVPRKVHAVIPTFLAKRFISVRIGVASYGSFTPVWAMSQVPVISSFLFNVVLLPLAWYLGSTPNLHFLVYAGEITVRPSSKTCLVNL